MNERLRGALVSSDDDVYERGVYGNCIDEYWSDLCMGTANVYNGTCTYDSHLKSRERLILHSNSSF